MANNATRVNETHIIVRHPDSNGDIVAKLQNEPFIPDDVANSESFIIQSVPDASSLTDCSAVDWEKSNMSASDKDLLRQIYRE